jgi:tetratricopeptide (TPR) repeat protein
MTVAAQQAAIEKELAPLETRRAQLRALMESSPARFIEESISVADAYAAFATRYASVSQSQRVRMEAATLLLGAAATARYSLKKPAQAIALYRRATTLNGQGQPGASALAYAEEIADIQQFDLGDRAAAAATFQQLRKALEPALAGTYELKEWNVWKVRWIDAELAYLASGKPFQGEIDTTALASFFAQIYYGFGKGTVAGVLPDPSLNPFNPVTIPPAEMEKKLSAPPSHSTFLQTWLFISHLPNAASVQKWLSRNDPGGYWTASLLTVAAVVDRDLEREENASEDVIKTLVRTESNQPTPLALLAREYAKKHPIPARGNGH